MKNMMAMENGLLSQLKEVSLTNKEVSEMFENFLSTKEWTEEEERTFAWAGAGLPALPCVEYFRGDGGSPVLFLTKKQYVELYNKLHTEDSTFLIHVESAFGEEDLYYEDLSDIFIFDEDREKIAD